MVNLTTVNVKKTGTNLAQFVQDEKIRLSRHRISQFQGRKRFTKEYLSFNGTVADRNKFPDPERFFLVMSKHPEWYRRKFTFLPKVPEAIRDLPEAAKLAADIVKTNAAKYGRENVTGRFAGTMREIANGALALLESRELTEASTFTLISPLAYGGVAEKNALYFYSMQGILYHAAKRVKKAYPHLAVRFIYDKADRWGLGHRYDIPVLTIGARGKVREKIRMPGVAHRQRRRSGKTMRRHGYNARTRGRNAGYRNLIRGPTSG